MEGSKRVRILALLTAFLSAANVWAQLLPTKWDAETEILPISSVEEGDSQVGVIIKPIFRYRVYSLMDEPVEISQLAWSIPNSQAICTWRPKYWKPLGSPVIQEIVPPDVLAKIRIINTRVVGYLRDRSGSWMAPTSSGRGLSLVFDPGILDRPYLGSPDTFLKSLTPEQREKPYYGFNFPGSPNWKEFIRISSQSKTGAHWPSGVLDEPARYETLESARSILKRGFVLDSIRVEKISYD